MSKTMSSFVKEVKARLSGDTDEVIAVRNERSATAAIETQLAIKKGEVVGLEAEVERREDNVKNATFPTEAITDTNRYLQGVLNAREELQEKKDELDATNELIGELKSILGSFK